MGLFTFNINESPSVKKDIKRILKKINNLNFKTDFIMANITELTNKVTELSTKVSDLQVVVDQEQQEILDAIAKLEALVADGGTEEQRQALLDQLNSISTSLDVVSSDVASTIEEEVEEEPTEGEEEPTEGEEEPTA